jgi:hypothetical protein
LAFSCWDGESNGERGLLVSHLLKETHPFF